MTELLLVNFYPDFYNEPKSEPKKAQAKSLEFAKVKCFGVGYMGSKNKIVKKLIPQLPSAKYFVDLFAGGGGSSTGYKRAGCKVLLANEFVPIAADTYSANYPNTIVLRDDIRKLTPEMVMEKAGIKKYELDILDGSPPCCAFSTCGARDKNWGDKIKKYSDKAQSNIEDLFFDFIRMAKGIMPKVIIAENVTGLVKGSAIGYFNNIMRAFKDIGYQPHAKIMDASDYGVPQARQRVIFVCFRNDIKEPEQIYPKPLDYKISAEQALKDIKLTNDELEYTNIRKYAVYKQLITLKEGEKDFNLAKINRKKPSPTITATIGNRGAKNVCHWDNRALCVREVKRLFALDDDYILLGTTQQQMERMGRMVAPDIYKHLVTNLINQGVFND